MVNRGKSGVRVSVPVCRPRPVCGPVAVGFGVPWCDRASQADGACVVVAVAVGKALYKQLSALLAGRRAAAALPE